MRRFVFVSERQIFYDTNYDKIKPCCDADELDDLGIRMLGVMQNIQKTRPQCHNARKEQQMQIYPQIPFNQCFIKSSSADEIKVNPPKSDTIQ